MLPINTIQAPLVEHDATTTRIWLHYPRNPRKRSGTYLTLHRDGTITQETLLDTGEIVNHTVLQEPRKDKS